MPRYIPVVVAIVICGMDTASRVRGGVKVPLWVYILVAIGLFIPLDCIRSRTSPGYTE